MRPYYEDDDATLYLGDCREVLASLPERSGVVITDPPYSADTHSKARTNKTGEADLLIDFDPMTAQEIRDVFRLAGRVASRWMVATTAREHAAEMEREPPDGVRFVRFGVWTKIAPMPQVTADRPGQGWEAIAIMHRDGVKLRWNGGSRPAVWNMRADMNGEYPTQKPEPLIGDFVNLFSDPGETIIDPFCGAGTVALMAKRMGRKAIACDISERALEIAANRLRREASQSKLVFKPKAKQARLLNE